MVNDDLVFGPKEYHFQTDEKGKVTRIRERQEGGEFTDVEIWLDILVKDGVDISCTVQPFRADKVADDYTLYLRPAIRNEDESNPDGSRKLFNLSAPLATGITPGHDGPRPTPGHKD